jgi:type VI secretion system protein ImpF
MNFEIEGDLWMQPVPLRLYLKTQLDLETGNVVVMDSAG